MSETDNRELIEALEQIEKEKKISKSVLLEAIENSLLAACKNHFGKSDNIKVIIDNETGEVKEQEIFLGDMPVMTDSGSFIFNGSERVIVSQLFRFPSVYYGREIDKNGRSIIS